MKTSIIILASLAAPASALTWNNAGPSNNWSTSAGDTNWDTGAAWTNGSPAVFGGTGETIALSAGVTATTVTFNAPGYTIDFGANAMTWTALGGTGGFTKTGAATLTLSGASTASGTVAINAGRIHLGNATAIGTSTVTLNNGAMLSANGGMTVANGIAIGSGGGNLAGGAGDYANYNGIISGGTAGTTSITINTGHTSIGNPSNTFAGNVILSGGFYLRTTASEVLPNAGVVEFTSASPAFKINPTTTGTYTETIGGIQSSAAPYGVFAEGSAGVIVNLKVGGGDTTSSYTGPLWQTGGAVLNLEKIGTGTFTRNQASGSLYTGTTTITGGTLAVAGGNAIPNAGSVSLADTSGVVLQLDAAEVIGSLSGGGASGGQVNLQANALTVGGTASTTFSGIISGTDGSLVKSGTGTLTLAGANTYTGATTISGGGLLITGSTAATSAVTVVAGGTLGGTGTVNGNVSSDGIIAPGVSATPATLHLADGLSLNAGTLAFDVSGASSDRIEMNGGDFLVNGSVSILLSGVTGAGTYTLVTGASASIDTSSLTASVTGPYSATLDNSVAGTLIAHIVAGNTLTWNGTAGLPEWTPGGSTNWLKGAAPSAFANGDIVNFTEAAAEKNISLNQTVAPSSTTFNHTSAYELAGSGSIGGVGGLVKQGSGTLVLATSNSYSGVTSVEGGTLRIDNGAALGADTGATDVAAGARLDLYGLTAITEPVGLAGILESTYPDSTASLLGNVVLSGTPEISTPEEISISGILSGTAGFTKTGAAALTLSGANTFTGNVTVSAGTLIYGSNGAPGTTGPVGPANPAATKVAISPEASVNLNGQVDCVYGYTIAGTGVAGEGALFNNGAAISTGTKQTTSITLAANASIGGTGGWCLLAPAHGPTSLSLGGFTLTKTGTNTISLNNTTLTAGAIEIATGGLRLGVNGGGFPIHGGEAVPFTLSGGTLLADQQSATIGSLAGSSGAVTIASGLTLTTGDLNSSTTFAGVVSGAGTLAKNGTGTLTLSGINTHTGNTVVNAGTLEFASGSELRFAPNNTTSNQVSGNGAATFAGSFVIAPTGITVTTGSWTLVTAGTLGENYSGSFSIKAADGTPWSNNAGTWTLTDAAGKWTYTQSTGLLTLAPGGSTFDSWMSSYTFAPGADTTANGDADLDGIPNVVEHVLGTAPNAATTGLTQITGSPGTLAFKHPLNASIAGNVTWGYQWSSNLSEWKSSSEANTSGTIATISAVTAAGESTVTTTLSGTASSKVFVRLQATANNP